MDTEFKLQLPHGAAAAAERKFHALPVTSIRLRARYFDTRDAALRSVGLTLRLRQEGLRWVQTATFAGAGLPAREEHEVDLGGVHEAPPALPDVSLHQGTPVGKLLQQALGRDGKAAQALVEMFSTDVERLRQQVRVGESSVDVALDRGEVTVGTGPDGRSLAIEELELELTSGTVGDLAALARQWCGELEAWVGTESEADKGWRLVGAPSGADHRAVRATPPLPQKASGAALMRSLVARCLAEFLPHADRVASGRHDEEAVHQLRVGIRRLRTVLRELPALAHGVDPAWEPSLAATFGRLGQWRDQSNIEAGLLPELARHGAPDLPTAGPNHAAADEPSAAVREPAFQQCLIALMAFAAEDPDAGGGLNPKRTRALLRKKVKRLHDRLASAAGEFEALAPAEQHGARKRLKRLRYLVEFVGPLFDPERADAFIKRIKPAQDALGLQNDEAVALETLQELTSRHAQAWFGVGWYSARRAGLARASRKALVKAVARKPW